MENLLIQAYATFPTNRYTLHHTKNARQTPVNQIAAEFR